MVGVAVSRYRPLLCASLSLLMLSVPARASESWGPTLELLTGTAFNIPTPLHVEQAGAPDLSLIALYDTHPFEGDHAPWYLVRAGAANDRRGLALEILHHKLYLRNPPPEIQRFEVTHGYTLIGPAYAWRWPSFVTSLALGAILAYPHNTIRGSALDESSGLFGSGYHISGAGLHGAVAARWRLFRYFALTIEAGLSAAYANVPVAGGSADVPNIAFQLAAGVVIGR